MQDEAEDRCHRDVTLLVGCAQPGTRRGCHLGWPGSKQVSREEAADTRPGPSVVRDTET